MQINTSLAFLVAAISSVFGFGIAFYLESKIKKVLVKKSQKYLSTIAAISVGYGFSMIINEVGGAYFISLAIRWDKIISHILANLIIAPIILSACIWVLHPKINTIPSEKSTEINFTRDKKENNGILNYLIGIAILTGTLIYFWSSRENESLSNESNKNSTITINEEVDKIYLTEKGTGKGLTLIEIRRNYPEYNDLSDEDLSEKLRNAYYKNYSRRILEEKLGYRFICSFTWNAGKGNFVENLSKKEIPNNYNTTYIYRTGKEEYVTKLTAQLRVADKNKNTALAREITAEIRRNTISIFFDKNLNSEFINTVAESRQLKEQCD